MPAQYAPERHDESNGHEHSLEADQSAPSAADAVDSGEEHGSEPAGTDRSETEVRVHSS